MALHKHKHEPHVSSKAQFGVSAFQEAKHKRDASGKFADKPGVGDDAPKKPRPEGGFSKAEDKGGTLKPKAIDPKHAIEITVKGNPKKGTAAQRFALYKPGMTVEEYIAAVGDKKQALRDIAWDSKQGWIKTAPPKPKDLSGVGAAATVGTAGTATAGLGAAAAASAAAATEAQVAAAILFPTSVGKLDNLPDDFRKALNLGKDSFEDLDEDDAFALVDALNGHGAKINKFDMSTHPDKDVVTGYTGEDYGDLNYNLRSGLDLTDDQKKIVGSLDKIINNTGMPEDTILHRVIGGKAFNGQVNGLKKGDTLMQESYLSTTLHPDGYLNVLDGLDETDVVTKMQILARKGTKGAYLEEVTAAANEYEVLLPRGAALTFIGKKGDIYQFEYAEAVAKADLPLITQLPPLTDLSKAAPSVKAGTLTAPIPTAGYTKTGAQLGSNEGGTFTSPNGEKFYIKTAKSEAHAENELLANAVYEKLGMATLRPQAFDMGGKVATGSKIEKLGKFNAFDPKDVALAQKDFVSHAFLANWDAVGLEYDNLAYVGGKLTMLDAGGALKFRAQGGLKPGFGPDVTELDTMRSDINPTSKKVFGSMTNEQIRESAKPVLALSDKDIDDLVASQVINPERAAEFASVLKARRDNIATRLNLAAKTESAEKAVAANIIESAAAKGIIPPKPSAPTPTAAAPAAAATTPAAVAAVSPPAIGTKSTVPLAKGVPVVASTNPDPIPLGTKLGLDHTLHLEVQGNPKIAGAKERFALYKDGMTLQDYIEAVGNKKQALQDVAWDMKQGWISAAKPGAVAKAAAAAATSSTTATADQVYNKLRGLALKPTPNVVPAPPPAPKPPADLAPAFPKADLAPKPAVALPSAQVAYEAPIAGTTVMDTMSKTGGKTTDTVYPAAVYPSNASTVANSLESTGTNAFNSSGTSNQFKAAGEQIGEVSVLLKSIPLNKLAVSTVMHQGKYVGAMAAKIDGASAEILHVGSLKSGIGGDMLAKLADDAAGKGASTLTVKTKVAEFYTKNGFKPTAEKDVYSLDISAKAQANVAAAAAVGAPISPPAKAPAPLADLLDKTEAAASKAALGSTLPFGHTTSSVGKVTIVNDPGGHKYDLPGGGGVAALDVKSLAGQTVGTQTKTTKFNDNDYIKISSDLSDSVAKLKAAGKLDTDGELAATQKAQKIVLQSDLSDPDEGTALFGFSTNSSGKLKGAISAATSKDSDAVVITDHAGLGGGSGKSALDQLITSAQNLGKKEILVKSGMVDFYKGQGFTPSLTANGYLSLKIDPVTYKPPGTLAAPAYGSASSVSENLLKQIVKPSATPNTAHVNIADYKKYYDGAGYTAEYNDYLKNTLDKPFEGQEKYYAKAYTATSSINKPLRDGVTLTSTQKEQFENMSKAIAKTSFKEDHVLYRGMYADDQLKSLFGMLEKGDHFVNPAFTSTTIKPDIAGAFGASGGVGMKIYAKKGAKGLPVKDFSNHPGELETILPASAALRFLGRDASGLYEFEYV